MANITLTNTDTARSPWTAWEGGACPVEPDVMVTAILRRMIGDVPDSLTGAAGEMDWAHGLPDSDDEIVAFRLTQI